MKQDVTVISAFNAKKYVKKDYESCALRLAYSIRKNGGKYKDIPIIFWVEKEASAHVTVLNKLSDLGCKVFFGDCSISHPTPTGS